MAKNKAQIEIEIQNAGAIAALQSVIGSAQSLNREAISLRYGFQSAFFVAQQSINAVLGSSIQLEQQLISIRASLAATNDIQSFGKSIADPLERINALAPAVNKAIAQVRRDSLELANVTSDDLINVFQIISGQVGNIGADLNDAAKLTKAFASSFSTLGIPLFQARQEVTSILQGQIDQNSALAKTININNIQIQQEKAKGTLVQFLIDKTSALASGQSLVAKTFGGVTSNLVEILQRVQEAFGKVVLPPLVEQLTKIYDSLIVAQPQIEAFFKNVGDGFISISSGAKLVFDSVSPLLQELGKTVAVIAQTSLPIFQTGLTLAFSTLTLIGNVLTTTLTPVLIALQSDFGRFAITIGLTVVALNQLVPLVIGLSTALLKGLLTSISLVAFTIKSELVTSFISFTLGANAAAAANLSLAATFQAVLLSTGVLVGGIAALTGGFLIYKAALDASKVSQEAWKNSVDGTEKVAGNFIKRLKELQEQQKQGTITDADRKKLDIYKKLLKDTADSIPSQIADIQKAVDKNKVFGLFGINETEAKQEIERLKKQQADVLGILDDTRIKGQKATTQGDLKKQFSVISDNFFKEFQQGTQLSVTQAKEFIKILNEEVELGIRSKESGLERLKALSQAEFILRDDRIAAAKAATAIIDKESKLQTAILDAQQSVTQSIISQGLLSEIEGINKLGELKAKSKQTEIDAIDEKLKYVVQGSNTEQELLTQRKKAVADLAKSEIDFVKEQVTALRSGLERELSANDNLRKKAEAATQADILELKIEGLDEEAKIQENALLVKKQTIESEIADQRRLIEFQKVAATNSNLSAKEREEAALAIGEAEAKLGKLQLDSTDNLISRVKNFRDQITEIKGALDRELNENNNDRTRAEQATQAQILALRIGGFQNEKQLEEQSLLTRKQNLEQEIADTKRKIAFEKESLTNSKLTLKEREEKLLEIGAQEIKLGKLQLDQTDNLISRVKILYDQRVKALDIEKTTNERVGQLLESQGKLLSAQSDLSKAVANAQVKSAENNLTNLKEAAQLLQDAREKDLDEQTKQELKTQKDKDTKAEKERLNRERLADLGINAGQSELQIATTIYKQEQKLLELKARRFEAEQAAAQQQLEIQIQQSAIRDKQLLIESKIALTRAKESGDNDAIASALELVGLSNQQVSNNQKIAGLQRQTLNATQGSERETFNLEQAESSFKNRITAAGSRVVGLTSRRDTVNGLFAKEVTASALSEDNARENLAVSNSPERVQQIQNQRKKDFADVADGTTAFKDTSKQVAANFASLPESLKATKAALQDVVAEANKLSGNTIVGVRDKLGRANPESDLSDVLNRSNELNSPQQRKETQSKLDEVRAQSKELDQNPIFEIRNQQAAKQAQSEAQQKQRSQQQSAQIKAQVDREASAINKQNTQIKAQNQTNAQFAVLGNTDKALGIGAPTLKETQLKRDFPDIRADELNALLSLPENSDTYKILVEALALRNKKAKINRFTGGYAPADTPVTVNEQGQEAATNLRTGETSLLPYGERQVIFGDTAYVHNASDTRQMLSATQAIADRPQNNLVLDALGKIHDLIASREVRLGVTNNFTNESQPDHRVYELTRAMMRAVAV